MRKSDEERGRPGIFRHVHDVRWMWGGGGGGGGGGGATTNKFKHWPSIIQSANFELSAQCC